MRRHPLLLGLAVMLGLGVVACSSAAAPVSPSQPAQRSATPVASPSATARQGAATPGAQLSAELLTAADLPPGWSVQAPASAGSGGRGCFSAATSRRPEQAAHVSFVQGTAGLPLFAENLAAFPSGAHDVFVATEGALSACHSVSFTASGQSFSGTVAVLPFPSFGDESAAYVVTVTAGGQGSGAALGLELVLVRRGSLVLSTLLVDAGTADAITLTQLTARAVAKLH
jgi:hypothetical protein